MKIAIGNDHVSVDMKKEIIKHLEKTYDNIEYREFGFFPESQECSDYPIYAELVGTAVADGEYDCGILICGTGVGFSIAANKVNGIRAAVCSEPYSAKLSKEHNHSNVLCFGSRVIGIELAKMIVDAWLAAEYKGDRHQRRVDLIMEIERKNGF